MTTTAPSYYDSIGLLAICDSIDAVDGIPFYPEDPKLAGNERTPSSGAEPGLGSNAHRFVNPEPLQHTLLTHIPVTGVLSPVGSIPYSEQQRVAYSQLASTGQLPANPINHTVGGVRPNVPVAHNLHGNNSNRGKSLDSRTPPPGPFPAGPNGSVQQSGTSTPNGPNAAMPKVGGSGDNNSLPAGVHPDGKNWPADGLAGGPLPDDINRMDNAHMNDPNYNADMLKRVTMMQGKIPSPAGVPGVMPQGPPGVPGLPNGANGVPGVLGAMNSAAMGNMGSAAGSPVPMGPTPTPMSVPMGSPNIEESRATTPASPADNSQIYRVEVCQICGRDFKGRKAATHKQQHIRRLHPAAYTPKRGGKKSRTE